jgi:hypothetical protein
VSTLEDGASGASDESDSMAGFYTACRGIAKRKILGCGANSTAHAGRLVLLPHSFCELLRAQFPANLRRQIHHPGA